MINEKEIRTGNIYSTIRNVEIVVKGIDTINKFVTVDSIDPQLEVTGKASNSIIFEDLHPIEITSIKAERLGFDPETLLSMQVTSDNGAKFQWDEKTNQVVFKDCSDGSIGQNIRYIHQFQNLFFFLTGKELVL